MRYACEPALPAGLSRMPRNSTAPTTSGEPQKSSGTSRGTQLHATARVSRPVGTCSMMRGATRAPRMPPRPASMSMHADRARVHAVLHEAHDRDVEDRVDGEVAGRRERHHGAEVGTPEHVAQALDQVGAHVARRPVAAGREVGADPRQRDERDRKGDRVEDERHRAAQPDEERAERSADEGGDVVAGLVLAQCRRQLVAGDDRADRRRLGRAEDAGADAGEQRGDDEVPQPELAHQRGDGDQAVDDRPRPARQHHQPLAVGAVDDHAGRQERARPSRA